MGKFAALILAVVITLTSFFPAGCYVPRQADNLPPPKPQPVLSSVQDTPPRTSIIDGPSGTINYNVFTFKWTGTDDKTTPEKLLYSTFLEGYDRDWTVYTPETSREFSKVPGGSYTFYVKAQDESGNIEKSAASRNFTIAGVVPTQPPQIIVPGVGGFLLTGSDVSRVVVANDGKTLYAIDSLNSKLYRSDTQGIGWVDLSGKVGGGPPWIDVAVAPDNSSLVAVLTDAGREVYISDYSVASFNSTGMASAIGAQAATCIAISPDYGAPRREIAAGTVTGGGGGRVLINILSRFPSGWMDASSGAAGWTAADVFAIEFSPSFAGDGSLLCVASTAAKSYLYLAARDLGSRNTVWNASPGYPVELCNPGAGTPGTPLNYADISLPADYNGSSAYARHAFVSWSRNHPSQDVYHIVDAIAYRMNVPEPVASIAFWGATSRGKLMAGAAKCQSGGCYQVQTYFTGNPMSVCPSCPMWQPSQKAPTGQSNARVAWSPRGDIAYAGTTGVESALSHSFNNGYTWNQ